MPRVPTPDKKQTRLTADNNRQKLFRFALLLFGVLAVVGSALLVIGMSLSFTPVQGLVVKTKWGAIVDSHNNLFSFNKELSKVIFGKKAYDLLRVAIAGAALWFVNIPVFLLLGFLVLPRIIVWFGSELNRVKGATKPRSTQTKVRR